MRSDVRVEGAWPDSVQLRRGWALARARPWNDQVPTTAALRLERGGDRFISTCCQWLAAEGIEEVLSPAVTSEQTRIWRRAGFGDHLELVVFERSLVRPAASPGHPVVEVLEPDFERLARIDDRAFNSTWRVGRRGLEDAAAATSLSSVMVVEAGDRPAGFVIVGESGGISYLQRLAVEPGATGRGIGRSLVRSAISWARTRGGRTMLLNTQPENEPAARLYASEGFELQLPRLYVLSWSGSATP